MEGRRIPKKKFSHAEAVTSKIQNVVESAQGVSSMLQETILNYKKCGQSVISSTTFSKVKDSPCFPCKHIKVSPWR